MHLPDHFKQRSQQLPDGTVVQMESEAQRDANRRPAQHVDIEVAPSTADEEPWRRDDDDDDRDVIIEAKRPVSREKLAIIEQLQQSVADKSWAVEHPDPLVKSRVPISAAERRRLIREELHKLSMSDEPIYYQRRLY